MPPSLSSVPRPGTTVVENPFAVTTRTGKSTGTRGQRRVLWGTSILFIFFSSLRAFKLPRYRRTHVRQYSGPGRRFPGASGTAKARRRDTEDVAPLKKCRTIWRLRTPSLGKCGRKKNCNTEPCRRGSRASKVDWCYRRHTGQTEEGYEKGSLRWCACGPAAVVRLSDPHRFPSDPPLGTSPACERTCDLTACDVSERLAVAGSGGG